MAGRLRRVAVLTCSLAIACGGDPGNQDDSLLGKDALRARTRVEASAPLQLSTTSVAAGATVTGRVTYVNRGSRRTTLQNITIASRPPGGTAEGGPFMHFVPQMTGVTLEPGQSVTLTATRTFNSSDPSGAWFAYSAFQDATGAWTNGASVAFQVSAGSSTPTPTPEQWSIAFYPGWAQNRIAPSTIDYSPWTHIFHFGMYPGTNGEVLLADMQSSAYPADAIAQAHAAKKKIVLVIGGESTGSAFLSATTDARRATFVRNIVATLQKYGYDGVDVDWEESVNEAQFVALLAELRTALNAITPRPSLTADVATGLVSPSTAAKALASVDTFNIMSYWTTGQEQITAYRNAGIPASKLILGIGLSTGYRDQTAALVQAKIDSVKAAGLRGVHSWQVGDLNGSADARLAPLRQFVAAQGIGTATGAMGRVYPIHTGIISTTFWVGEIFDPNASDGSQVISTYDSSWMVHYGGCDGVASTGKCSTEVRTAANGYFPTQMVPKENPFYLDLPFDDINDSRAFARRAQVIPWANDPGYAGHATDSQFSYMKNRWVKLMKGSRTCYGQIEDAGPGQYNDAEYVFGSDDRRPLNKNFNNAGMDVSPALNGCLGFADLDGENDLVNWQFVDDVDVPDGPWKKVVTTRGVLNQ